MPITARNQAVAQQPRPTMSSFFSRGEMKGFMYDQPADPEQRQQRGWGASARHGSTAATPATCP